MALNFGLMRRYQERTRNEGRVVAELPAGKKSAPAAPQGKGLLAGKQLEDFLSASLSEDLAALKGLASKEAKARHKREILLPKYAPYVERLKEGGATPASGKHDLLGYWLVWLFDAGKMDEATQYADWCLQHGVKLPERFQSDIRFFIASQVVEWAEGEFNAGRAIEPYWGWIHAQAEQNPEIWNLPDELAGRLCRIKGLDSEKAGNLDLALFYLESALKLGAKVKTALERVQKNIKRPEEGAAQATQPTAPAEQSPGDTAAGDDSPATAPGAENAPPEQ